MQRLLAWQVQYNVRCSRMRRPIATPFECILLFACIEWIRQHSLDFRFAFCFLSFLPHIPRGLLLAKCSSMDSDAVMCANQHVVGAGCWPSSGECPFCRTPSMPPFPQPCRFIRSQVSGLRFKCACRLLHVELLLHAHTRVFVIVVSDPSVV